MKPLIPPQEAEIAFRAKIDEDRLSHQDEIEAVREYFDCATEAANKRFAEDYAPVLEESYSCLKKQKAIMEVLIDEFPTMAKNLNFKGMLIEIESALTNLNKLMK